MVNQSLLDALLCFSRVVVPMARCFSSDSYGGIRDQQVDRLGGLAAQPVDGVKGGEVEQRRGHGFLGWQQDEIDRAILRQPMWSAAVTG